MFDPTALPFVDQLRIDLLAVEAQLRPLIRRLHYDPAARWPHRTEPLRTRHGHEITISGHEARTLLRGAIPFPMTTRPRHERHAELVAALATFAAELHGLNIPQAGDTAIAAGLDLVHALKAWIARMRWTAATAAAGTQWPAPKQPADLAVTAVTRHRTAPADPALFSEAAPVKKPSRRKNRHAEPPKGEPQRSMLLPIGRKPTPIAAPIADNQAHDNQAHDNQVVDNQARPKRVA
jgi:hypothetical protein